MMEQTAEFATKSPMMDPSKNPELAESIQDTQNAEDPAIETEEGG